MTEGINPAFDLIGLTQLRNDPQFAGIDGSGFAVAIIDSGLDFSNPLLDANYVTGFDFINEDNNPDDLVGHGTHVSGTVGAADEAIGVAPDVGLIGLKVAEAELSNRAIIDALRWVLNNHEEYNIVAVNMSLGGGFFTSEEEVTGDSRIELINRLEQEGVVVVAAAGNSYQFKNEQERIPNEVPNLGVPSLYSTLAVGAVWQDDNDTFGWYSSKQIPDTDHVAVFSQRLDANNFILAPGALINSSSIDGGLEVKAGTSMASPHVAGAVALLQEAALQFSGRLLTPNEVVDILRSTADTVVDGDDEEDIVANTGLSFPRLNIYNAVVEVKQRADGIAPPPDDNDPEQPNKSDPNGTIAGAFIGPTLDGEPVEAINGTIGVDGNGTLVGDKDVDIFRFEVESPGLVTIELDTREDDPEDFDTYLRLFDANGTELAFNDDIEAGVQQFSRLEALLEPGTYYAGVSGYNNESYDPNVAGSGISAATGNYSIQFDLDNSDPNGLISGAREVLLGNDLEPLIFPGLIGADYGEPVGVSDVDLFRIIVPDDGVLFVDIDTPYEEDYVDSFLRLFNEEGEELFFSSTGEPAASDDDLSFNVAGEATEFLVEDEIVIEDSEQTTLINGDFDEDGNYIKGNYGHRTDSFLGINVNRGDVYYVGVSDYFNSEYDPTNLDNRLETGEGGQYELIATFANKDLNGSITQINTITDLPLNDVANIGEDEEVEVGNRDVDFWRFNSTEAGILEIDIDAETVDTIALLFNSDGKLLTDNDDNDGLDPLLRYQIESDTDYYVAITGYGNQNFDPFALGSGSGGDTGEYNINASLLDLSQASSLQDNNVNSESVRNLILGDRVVGNIGEDNGFFVGGEDIDLYRFVPEENTTVNIRVSADEAFSANTFLRLFDAIGNEIAFNDDENSLTRGSFLQQEVTAGTEYIIGVNGSSENAREYNPLTGEGATPGSQGDYSLTVSELGSEPEPGDHDLQTIELFRFRNTTFNTGTYVFVGETEKNAILADENLSNTFALDGVTSDGTVNSAFTASLNSGEDLIPFYRLKSLDVPGTFLFVSTGEYEGIFAEDSSQKDKWEKEGLDNNGNDVAEFYLYSSSADGRTQFNRFQNTQNGTFLYAGAEETNAINSDSNLSSIFNDQGTAFYSI